MSKITLTAANATETRIAVYLEANASDMLAAKINAGTKTLAGAMAYAKSEARKLADGDGCVCVDDATVFGWIIHFFEEDDIKQAAKKPAFKSPSGAVSKKPDPVQPVKPAKTAKPVKDEGQLTMFESLFKG